MALKLKSSMAPSTWVALAAFVIFSFWVLPRAMGARLLEGLEWPCCREYEAPPTALAADIDSVYDPYPDLAPAAPWGPIVPLNPDSFCDCPGPGPEPKPAPPPHAGGIDPSPRPAPPPSEYHLDGGEVATVSTIGTAEATFQDVEAFRMALQAGICSSLLVTTSFLLDRLLGKFVAME